MNAGWRSGSERCRSATRQGIANRKLIEMMSRGAADLSFPDRSHHIGSKDFPMPEKTHTESCREAASLPSLPATDWPRTRKAADSPRPSAVVFRCISSPENGGANEAHRADRGILAGEPPRILGFS